MKYLFLILTSVFLFGFSKKPIKIELTPQPSIPEGAIYVGSAEHPGKDTSERKGSLKDISDIAKASDCSKINWKDRGRTKVGYYKGMALSWARQVCNPLPVVYSSMSLAQKKYYKDNKMYYTDVLAHYNLDVRNYKATPFKSLGLSTAGGIDTARAVWTLLIGLGMREASGQPWVGRDASMGFRSADSAESGVMQSSYGARKAHADMEKLYQLYKTDKSGCFKDAYYEGFKAASAADLKNWGSSSSEGYKFQKFQKECPGFAVEYAAILVRLSGGGKGEYGPLRKKVAQVEMSCENMLAKVQNYVEANRGVCELL